MFVSSDFSIISLLFQCRAPIIYLRIVYFYSKIKPMIYFVFGKINFEMYFFRRSSKFLFFKSLNFFLENLRNFYNSYSTYLVHGEMLLESILSKHMTLIAASCKMAEPNGMLSRYIVENNIRRFTVKGLQCETGLIR